MKIRYTIKEHSKFDPKYLQDGDWVTMTSEHPNYKDFLGRAWKFKKWGSEIDQHILSVYFNGKICPLNCTDINHIMRIEKDDPNFKLILE